MNITAELSLYPLNEGFKPVIIDYIEQLHTFDGLEIRTHALSTEIFGDYETVMSAIQATTRTVFESDSGIVLAAKYLNRDRRDG